MPRCTIETENRRRGAVLGMVLVVVVLVSVLGAGMLHYTSTVAAETGRAISAAQAFWAAEAGLQELLALGFSANEPLEDLGLVGDDVRVGSLLRSGFAVSVTKSNDPDEQWPYTIESVGTSAGGQVSTVSIRSRLPTFGEYVMFSSVDLTPDDQPIYFGDGDTIQGPVYANGELNVWHDHPQNPIFVFPTPLGDEWLIMSAASTVNMHAGDLSVFDDDGTMYADGVPRSRLRLNQPEVSTEPIEEFFEENRSVAQAAGGDNSLSGDYDLEFRADGTVVYEKRSGGDGPKTNTIAALSGLMYIDGNAYIRGVVNGDLTLVVENGIHIEDDVVYESAQGPDPWSGGFNPDSVDDFLTLLTPEYVRIESQPGQKKDVTDRTLHASIYVTQDNLGEFYGLCAEDYDKNIGKPKLNLYGGVAQYRRGLVARPPNVDAQGTAASPFGYGKNFLYDERMEGRMAPYTTYLVSGWEYR